jgi:hypothetical protein
MLCKSCEQVEISEVFPIEHYSYFAYSLAMEPVKFHIASTSAYQWKLSWDNSVQFTFKEHMVKATINVPQVKVFPSFNVQFHWSQVFKFSVEYSLFMIFLMSPRPLIPKKLCTVVLLKLLKIHFNSIYALISLQNSFHCFSVSVITEVHIT